jgi:hypothetical protein
LDRAVAPGRRREGAATGRIKMEANEHRQGEGNMTEDPKDFILKDQPPESGGKGASDSEAVRAKKAYLKDEDGARMPKIDFSTFVISLNSSALVQLGILDDPTTGEKSKNLTLAKQTIDVLGMMEEKTQGNLNADEAHMLKSILYDLRILYVKEKG